MKSAIIVQGGGLRGAYAVGVLRKLHSNLTPHHQIDGIYAVSSGVFAATYFLAGQVEDMENTWRNKVCGRYLVDYWNIFKNQPILKLDYLISLFQNEVLLRLENLENIFNRFIDLKYVVTDYESGIPEYRTPKKDNIFDLMRAASALPCMYSNAIILNGKRYFDGGQSDPLPVKKVIEDGYTNIFVIMTRPKYIEESWLSRTAKMLCLFKRYGDLEKYKLLRKNYLDAKYIIEHPPDGVNIDYIYPTKLNINGFTRKQTVIIEAIEQGKKDLENLIRNLKFVKYCSLELLKQA